MGCNNIYANNMVPAGSYICLNCKKETVLHLKDYLTPCSACGGDVFALNAMINLSEEEIKNKFAEIVCIRLQISRLLNKVILSCQFIWEFASSLSKELHLILVYLFC